jgi:hypothetical protein
MGDDDGHWGYWPRRVLFEVWPGSYSDSTIRAVRMLATGVGVGGEGSAEGAGRGVEVVEDEVGVLVH